MELTQRARGISQPNDNENKSFHCIFNNFFGYSILSDFFIAQALTKIGNTAMIKKNENPIERD